ncbi:MAG: GTP-dependent dephospho-CoA kinase family protein [Haloarculaceae archaeon]
MLTLPAALRSELKDPLGEVYTEPETLLSATAANVSTPNPQLISVGDVVTAHLVEAGRQPDVSAIDGRTEREPIDDEIDAVLDGLTGRRVRVENESATLSESLLTALRDGIRGEHAEPVTISVDGEEDLAALPAIVLADTGASVVYGQPGEGMVHVAVDDAVTTTARELLARFDGDTDAALAILDAHGLD